MSKNSQCFIHTIKVYIDLSDKKDKEDKLKSCS